MEFNFNHFFGYESVINKNPDLVLIYGFAFIIFGLMALTFIALIFSKIGLQIAVKHFIAPLMQSMVLCLFVAIIPTVILSVVANDVSGVKLLYCWITIFSGITIFCFLHYPMINKWSESLTNRSNS
jgi:hypothetical protein